MLTLECLLRIQDRVEKVSVRPELVKRGSELIAPLFTSMLLPILAENAIKLIFKI